MGDTIRGSRKWLGWSWRHINLLGGCDFSGGKLEDSVRIKPPKIGGLKAVWFWEQQKDVSRCVYPVCRKSRGVLRTFVGRTPSIEERAPISSRTMCGPITMLGAQYLHCTKASRPCFDATISTPRSPRRLAPHCSNVAGCSPGFMRYRILNKKT